MCTKKKKSPYFVCEGLRTCQEAIKHRPDLISFSLISDDFRDGAFLRDPYIVSASEFAELAQTENP